VFCNDTIHVEMTVIAKRETSKPDRGIVTFRHEVKNQAGEVTLEMEKVRMIRRRPAGEAAGSSSGTK
jgi:acyl dehydratase